MYININKSFIDINKSFININKSFINIRKCSFCPLWPSIKKHAPNRDGFKIPSPPRALEGSGKKMQS